MDNKIIDINEDIKKRKMLEGLGIEIKNSKRINDKTIIGIMSFGDFLNIVDKGLINIDNEMKVQIDQSFPESKAISYNNNKEIKEIEGFEIDLLVENITKISIADGIYRYLIVKHLDKRFMNSLLLVRLHFKTKEEMISLLR